MDEGAFSAMPSGSQEFCLRWNNFHSSLVSALDGFKNEQDFVDVTIACEGQYLKAHKMLLSACSVFFRDLLKANPCQHPIIILPPEVRFLDLERLLRFIYQGEVNVQQESLAKFLKTAEMLKIRGLADDSEKQKVFAASSPRPPEGSGNSSVSPKRPRLSLDAQEPSTPNDDSSRLSGPDSDSEMIPVKQEMIELKDGDLESADNESFLSDSYIKDSSSSVMCDNSQSQDQGNQQAPPPPGPLLPSYIPPPQARNQEGVSRSSSHQVGGLIRRFLEECLQLPEPGVLLSCYSGLEGTPHFQLLRSVAKEWSYCKNATSNYSSMGGSSKRQRATSRLIETFESIDTLRSQLANLLHQFIVMEISQPGLLGRVCRAEPRTNQLQGSEGCSNIAEPSLEDYIKVEGLQPAQSEAFIKATDAMKQLRKLYFDQSRRLAVRISQLKKGRQQCQERIQRHQQQQQMQQSFINQTLQQLQQQQLQQQSQQQSQQLSAQVLQDAGLQLSSQASLALHGLHQPWSD